MTANSPFVSRKTIQWLRCEHAQLGEAMLGDLGVVIHHHRLQNLCGLVYDAAHVLELPEEETIALGSWADLFYCTIGALDDIQDGDADRYMPWPLARQVNAAMALLTLSERRLLEVWRDDPAVYFSISCQTTQTTHEMVCAQHAEILARAEGYAPPWDVFAYERHALWTAGAEVALFLGGVGASAGGELTAALREAGYACGVLLQIRVDYATNDNRITVLPGEDVDGLRQRHTELFFQHAKALPIQLVAMLVGIAGIGDETCQKSRSPKRPKPTSTPSQPRVSTPGSRRRASPSRTTSKT